MAAVEWNKAACDTLTRRLEKRWGYPDAERRVLRFDLQRTDELLKGWKNDREYGSGEGLESVVPPEDRIDLVIGGPPCQPFSKSGYWAGGDSKRLDDPRADTLRQYLRVLRDTRPRAWSRTKS